MTEGKLVVMGVEGGGRGCGGHLLSSPQVSFGVVRMTP